MTSETRSEPSEPGMRQCPYCREQVRADAVRCRACGSSITPTDPGHQGTCPFCKEHIDPAATRCSHCRSDLTPVPPTTAMRISWGGARPGGPGLGLLDDACVTMLQNCYITCSLRHPEGDMRGGCEDSCDALYNICRSFG